jgi:hypothetical protein
MAIKQREVIRELDDGLAVAWDTTEVPEKVREEFRQRARDQVDLLIEILEEGGESSVIAVEAKVAAKPVKRAKEERGSPGPARRSPAAKSRAGAQSREKGSRKQVAKKVGGTAGSRATKARA